MTPSCFCLRHCVLYCPVDRIPLSRDEQPCMREAQYHSAAQAQNFPSTTGPTQLDPGSLGSDSRTSRGGVRLASSRGNGANSLLKQAIANRIKSELELEKKPGEESKPEGEMEMSRSIVGNPAWYRDDEGRTGFKPREWENLPNEQKDQVKKRKEKKKEDGTAVEEIDEELLRSREREARATRPPLERKLSKEEKKELKKKEKEDKKREKEEKKKEKEEKKKAEKEKRKSQSSLEEKADKKRTKEEEGIQEGTMELEQKQHKKKRKEREEVDGEKKERKRSRSREKSPKERPQLSQRKESDVSVASSSKSTDTVKHHPGKPPRHPSLDLKSTLPSSPSSSNDEDRRPPRQPKKTTIGERRDSSMSESSRISAVSHKSVTFSDRVQTHEIERIHLSSSEEDDVGVMSDDELSKPDSERRRKLVRMLQEQEEQTDSDEDFEEQERIVEQKMLEEEMLLRHRAMYPVYNLEETRSQESFYAEDTDPDRYLIEEDGSYISLDKLPAAVRRAIIADMRGREEEPGMGSMSKLHEEGPYPPGYTLPRSASGYLDDNYMVASYQQAMYGAFHHDHDEGEPHLPSSSHRGSAFSPRQQRRLAPGPLQTLVPQKFTDVPSLSSQGSSQEPTIREIVSPDDATTPRIPRTLGERRQLHQLHESFYDNVPSRTSSLVGVSLGAPRLSQGRGGSDSRLPVISPVKSPQDTPIPSPPRRESSTSIERRAFFESMNPSIGGAHAREPEQTPTPSPPRLTAAPPPAGVHKLLITTSTTSTVLTNRKEIVEKQEKSEEEMRQKFVRQFGARRAPKAEEEDPLDPGPTYGSKESVYSTDSRESVVSEASIRKESLIRRNFNY